MCSAGLNLGLTSHSSLNSLTSASQARDTHHYDGGGGATSQQHHHHHHHHHHPRTTNARPAPHPTSNALTATNSASASNLLLLAPAVAGGSSSSLSNGPQQMPVAAAGRASRAGIASAIATVAGAPLSFVNPLIGGCAPSGCDCPRNISSVLGSDFQDF